MKRVSLVGLILGVVAGAVASLFPGSWIFWLGLGLAIGLVFGSLHGRSSRRDADMRPELHASSPWPGRGHRVLVHAVDHLGPEKRIVNS